MEETSVAADSGERPVPVWRLGEAASELARTDPGVLG